MARFEVKTIVPDYMGTVAGVGFLGGRAVVTSDTDGGLAALRYFRSAGYGIAALDGVGIDEVLAKANEAPEAEATRLRRENRALEDRLSLGDLREQNKRLTERVYGQDGDVASGSDVDNSASSGAALAPAGAGSMPTMPLAPPADSASQAEWRTWAAESGRMSEADAKVAKKDEIVAGPGADYDRERAALLQRVAEGGAA